MKFKTLLALLFIGIIVIFSIQNSEITDINFLFWKLSSSRVVIILGTFGVGILVGILISMSGAIFSKTHK